MGYRQLRCQIRHPAPRIEEVAARRLVEKSPDGNVWLSTDDRQLRLVLDGQDHHLSRREAARLRDELTEALTQATEFLRTTGQHRADGSYVVERRGADSAGHSKVFHGFAELGRLYERLPDEFGADEVGRTGLTGGRRHMLVHHLAEHPAFDCSLVSHQPLTVRKDDAQESGPTDEVAPAD